MIPAYGICACQAFYPNEPPAPTIEAHLLDFNRDLFDQALKLEFVAYLRPEDKNPSVQALMDQIQKDIDQTRKIILD